MRHQQGESGQTDETEHSFQHVWHQKRRRIGTRPAVVPGFCDEERRTPLVRIGRRQRLDVQFLDPVAENGINDKLYRIEKGGKISLLFRYSNRIYFISEPKRSPAFRTTFPTPSRSPRKKSSDSIHRYSGTAKVNGRLSACKRHPSLRNSGAGRWAVF